MKKKNIFKQAIQSQALEIIGVFIAFLLIFDFIITPCLTYSSTIFNLFGLLILIITMVFLFYYIKNKFELWNKKIGIKKNYEKEKNN